MKPELPTQRTMYERNPETQFDKEPAIVSQIGTMQRPIFVFGSNLGGRHGGGAASHAYFNEGAIMDVAVGPAGNSYAIPTLDDYYAQMPLDVIEKYVQQFIDYARKHPDLIFQVTPIGTGIAGFTHDEIAPMFKGFPVNCLMPTEWSELL